MEKPFLISMIENIEKYTIYDIRSLELYCILLALLLEYRKIEFSWKCYTDNSYLPNNLILIIK
ncbi:MAG: hypothetical protein K0S01_3158 [Herbinix sp.]|jgi:hypothetical protein|nr:hypothetical protein [Herbinix sp.]